MSTIKQNDYEALEAVMLKQVFEPFEGFTRCLIDAYVLVNLRGKPIKFNQLFTNMIRMSAKQILRRDSIEDFLRFEVSGKHLKIRDVVSNPTPTRIDEVRGHIIGEGSESNFILGVYPFRDANDHPIGAFLMIRDVTAETNLQDKYKHAKKSSITDPLTGLATRTYFEDYLELQMKTIETEELASKNRQISVLMADVDYFKAVNDTHGHQAGDHILIEVAKILAKSCRSGDVICRYGGEEFLVIFPGTEISGAQAAAEKIRRNIEAAEITFDGTKIPITISLGIAQINIGLESYSEAIARADQALYKAKKNGRNQVCISE